MGAVSERQVWEQVLAVDRSERGYDDTRCWWSQFRVGDLPPDALPMQLARPLLSEDVRGSLSAISNLSGFMARYMDADLRYSVRGLRRTLSDIENMTRGLRRALADVPALSEDDE
jgi:hypothetical protein